MKKRLRATIAVILLALGAATINVAPPAQAGDVRALIFPGPTGWGLGVAGWVQFAAYLKGPRVKVPCRSALRCNSVAYSHETNGVKDGEMIEQAFRGSAASATYNYNGSVTGFKAFGLKVRSTASNKRWRVTLMDGAGPGSPDNGSAVAVEWKGPGNHHRVVAIAYAGTNALFARHPLSLSKLLRVAISMASPSGGEVTLLTDLPTPRP